MSLHTCIERMKYIDDLIRRKATGDLTTFANKLNLSRSQTMEFLKEMKQHGFPIEYSRKLNSYYYSLNGKLVRHFFEKDIPLFESRQKELSQHQLRKISGGKAFFNFFVHSDYIGMNDSNFVK